MQTTCGQHKATQTKQARTPEEVQISRTREKALLPQIGEEWACTNSAFTGRVKPVVLMGVVSQSGREGSKC